MLYAENILVPVDIGTRAKYTVFHGTPSFHVNSSCLYNGVVFFVLFVPPNAFRKNELGVRCKTSCGFNLVTCPAGCGESMVGH